jgi:hypothetical protein
MEPRAPTIDFAPKEEMPAPAADALVDSEVMTLTMADSCSLEQDPSAASIRDFTECKAVVMAEAGGLAEHTRMLVAYGQTDAPGKDARALKDPRKSSQEPTDKAEAIFCFKVSA